MKQTNLLKSDFHILVRFENQFKPKYKIYNLITKKLSYDIEITGPRKKITEEDIIEFSKEKMHELDTYFDPNTKSIVKYPAKNYNKNLNYIFENILTKSGFRIRKNQIALSSIMFNSTMQGNIGLCEAEVGTGKTHAFLVALLMYQKLNSIENTFRSSIDNDRDCLSENQRKPFIISTSSIALQNAILKDYIPQISKLLTTYEYDQLFRQKLIDCQLSPVIRKGKEHYICDKKLIEINDKTTENRKLLNRLISLDYYEIDLDNLTEITESFKKKINVPNGCNNSCELSKQCRFKKLGENLKLKSNQIQICNHNYFLADIKNRKQKFPSLLPSYSAIVIDEAHKLEEVARQMYGCEITKKEVNNLVDVALRVLSKNIDIENLNIIGEEVIEINESFFDQLTNKIIIQKKNDDESEIARFKTRITKDMFDKMKSIKENLEKINKEVEIMNTMGNLKKDNTQELFNNVRGTIEKFKMYINNPENILYWLEEEKTRKIYKLCCIPKDLQTQLCNDIFQNKIPILLTSGTLSVDGDFTFLKHKLGINKIENRKINEISLSSPFNYENNCVIYVKDNILYPDYKNPNYINLISKEIEELIKATDGRTMVLFTSYKVLDLVYQKLVSIRKDYDFLKSTRGDINIIDKFKRSYKSVLFATGSCWEGIDIPGDSLTSLIIVKLPFPVPDPILDYKKTLFESNKEFFNQVLYPEMILKLKQGFGRLIRKETDTGVVSILDSRINKGMDLRDKVIACLPKCRVVNNIDDVKEFIKKNKSDDYFKVKAKK